MASIGGYRNFTGLGVTWENGSARIPDNETEVAAAAIGQSTLLASPLMMATAVSAVASGTWKPPRLVPDAPAGETHPVPGTAALREMMRSAAADGTGSATNLPGEPVHGKTGTADVGGAAPHAWFVGYRGGLGVAIVVVNGGGGGDVAAPIGADFFGALG